MSGTRFWAVVFAILALCGRGFVFETRHGDYDAASSVLVADQERLGEMQVLLAEEIPLTRAYRLLAAKYMTHEPSSDRIESEFTRIVADVARRHHVRFLEATFKQPLTALPAASPAPSSQPPKSAIQAAGEGSRLLPDGQPRYVVSDVDDLGDPSIGRPNIDGSLFTRIPLTLRLQGEWRPLVATIQDLSTHDVSMAFKNPSIEAQRSGVQLTLDAELLAPEIPAVPGVLVEGRDRGRTTLTHRPPHDVRVARGARAPRRGIVATHGRPNAKPAAEAATAAVAVVVARKTASTSGARVQLAAHLTRDTAHPSPGHRVAHAKSGRARVERRLGTALDLSSKLLTTRDYVTTPDESLRPIDEATDETGGAASVERIESPPIASSSAPLPAADEPEGP